MPKIHIKINNKKITAEQGQTILEVAQKHKIEIPALCYHSDLDAKASCRICVVEIKGELVTSCSTYPKQGMEILTDSEKVKRARRVNAELLMSEHTKACFMQNIEHDLCQIISDLGVKEVS